MICNEEFLNQIRVKLIQEKSLTHLVNRWNDFVDVFLVEPTNELRWVYSVHRDTNTLEQNFIVIVRFKVPVSFGSFDTYREKRFLIWNELPVEIIP